jgi:hypothetical protein
MFTRDSGKAAASEKPTRRFCYPEVLSDANTAQKGLFKTC